MLAFDLRREDEAGVVRTMIAYSAMHLQDARFPVGTIVGFAHTEFDPAAQPANDVPAPPTCHGYVRALGFDGWGNPHYDLECIQHGGVVRELPTWRLKKINLLEQLAIASIGSSTAPVVG